MLEERPSVGVEAAPAADDTSHAEPVPGPVTPSPEPRITGTTPPSEPTPARSRVPSALVWIGMVVVAAGLGVAGFFVGRAVGSDESPSAADVTTTASAPATTVPGATPTTLPPVTGDEPVAAVARTLSPSVVQIETTSGLGSGVVYDADQGLVLTAAHVVDGTDLVQVTLADGTRLTGTVLGADDGTDVAVVQVDGGGLVAAPLATGVELEVGQTAIAIGSPYGLEGTVTAGVVSAPERPVTGPDGRTRTMIQTDAAINPGNSGGALADLQGRVIGINDQIVSRSGGNDGVGFAIPVDVAVRAADSIVAGEPVEAGYLGVTGTTPETGRAGALITGVVDGSPADIAGLLVGDLVVSVDDAPITSIEDLAATVQAEVPGTGVVLEVVRGSETERITVELAVRPE